MQRIVDTHTYIYENISVLLARLYAHSHRNGNRRSHGAESANNIIRPCVLTVSGVVWSAETCSALNFSIFLAIIFICWESHADKQISKQTGNQASKQTDEPASQPGVALRCVAPHWLCRKRAILKTTNQQPAGRPRSCYKNSSRTSSHAVCPAPSSLFLFPLF